MTKQIEIEIAITEYINYLLMEGHAESSIKGYRTDFNRFISWLDGSWNDVKYVSDISQTIVREFGAYIHSKHAPTTANHNLIVLRGLLEFGVDNDWNTEKPVKAIKLKRIANQNNTKWLERKDITKLFHTIEVYPRWKDDRKAMNRAIMAILVNCGLRVAELVDLKMDDILLDSGLINVTSGKGNKFRRVPFGEKTANIIREWLTYHNGQTEYLFYSQRSPQMTTRAVQHMVKGISEMANVEFTPHVGRHTFGKNIADQSGRIESVATLLGHSNIQTTRRYIEPSLTELQSIVSTVEFE